MLHKLKIFSYILISYLDWYIEKLNITASNKIKDVYKIRINPTFPKISPINIFNACPTRFRELSKDKYTTKRASKSFKSSDGKEYPIKYMVISGGEDRLSKNIEDELKIVTDADNHDGKNIKIRTLY